MNQALNDILNGREENYLLPFFWQHDGHKEELPERIQKLRESGCRAFCLESRPFEDFCGETWWENLEVILREARRLDMKVWILDDKHFPTGYANGIAEAKYPERRRWYLREDHVDLMGPAREMSVLVPPCGREEKLIAACAFLRTGEGEELAGEPMALSVQPGDKFLYLDVPEGCWRVFFVYKTRAKDSNYISMLTPEGPQALIEAVYEPHFERFGEYFGNTIAGFFSDEPSLDAPYTGPWGQDTGFYYRTVGQPGIALPWEDMVLSEMEQRGCKEALNQLPALWYPLRGESQNVRLAYMDSVTALWRKNFSCQLGDWCRAHGVMYIGHIIEDMNAHGRLGCSAGHFFRALAGQDMSGIDIVLHQVMPGMGRYQTAACISQGVADPEFFHYMLSQLAASQARQNPGMRGRAMCEVFGAFGWAEGAPFMKWLMDFLLVRGVNHFVPHAFTDFFPDPDCPPHFFADGNDPQFEGFAKLMNYVNRAAHLLYGADMEAAGAVLYHAEAEWMEGQGCMPSQKPAKALYDKHIPYDVVSVDLLAQAQAGAGRFVAGGRKYGFLAVPACKYLPKEFWQAAKRLKAGGVPVLFVDAAPECAGELPGEIVGLQELPGRILDSGLAHDYRTDSALLRIARFDREASSAFFVFNEDPQRAAEAIRFPVKGRFLRLDLLNEVYEWAETEDGTVALSLEPGESVILLWGGADSGEWAAFPEQACWEEGEDLHALWDIDLWEQGKLEGYAPFKSGSELFNITGRNGEPEFSGKIRYRASVRLEKAPLCLDLGQVGVSAQLRVNGRDLGWRITAPYRWDITDYVADGENEIEIIAANTLANRLQDSLSRKMPIPPSGVLGPVRISQAKGAR